MNLLPKSEKDFADKSYWDDFFKKRSTKFEWYGEYPELCNYLHKYIKPNDDVLVVGCGNSAISSDLYDVGYRKIKNIDVSSVVIRKMKQANRSRTEMTFEEMDATETTFSDNAFSAVLDKGTLDALIPQDTEVDLMRGRKLIKEVARILKLGGRYIIISLLQEYILKILLEECGELGMMVRICRCFEVEEKGRLESGKQGAPVFAAICTKLKKSEKILPIIELGIGSNEKFCRMNDKDEAMTLIKTAQETNAMHHMVRETVLEKEIELEYTRDGENTPRFSIKIVDAQKYSSKHPKYGALIVPQGREIEWIFGTPEGRKVLRESSYCDRLAVIILNPEYDHISFKAIQSEVSPILQKLVPKGSSNQIPFLAVSNDVGKRKQIYSGKSQFSGDFVIEDVNIEKQRFRRLLFLNNRAVIQSEARLKECVTDGKTDWVVDTHYVASLYHCYMGLAVGIPKSPCSVLVLGLGGGALCTFILNHFAKAHVTGVDIDPEIVKVGKKYFGLRESERLHLVVRDGLKYLKACKKDKKKFDVVMIDINAKTSNSPIFCPPDDFLTDSIFNTYISVLNNTGILALNIVSRVQAIKEEILKRIRQKFGLVAHYQLFEDINHVILASPNSDLTHEQWKDAIMASANTINKESHDAQKDPFNLEELAKKLHF